MRTIALWRWLQRAQNIPVEHASGDELMTITGWGYLFGASTKGQSSLPAPESQFGQYWLTPQHARIESGDSIFLYVGGKQYEIDPRTGRVRAEEEEETFPRALPEQPLLRALGLAVPRVQSRQGKERVGNLQAQWQEWRGSNYREYRRWVNLEGGLVLIKWQVVFEDQAKGFCWMFEILEPTVQRVAASLFTPPKGGK